MSHSIATKKFKINEIAVAAKEKSWLKIFEPQSVDELLLHPKKLEDLRNWFKLCRESSKQNRILLLSGPTGCLKFSSIQLLAKEANYDVKEWITSQTKLTGDEERFNNQRQSEIFSDFLLKSSRFPSVFNGKDSVLVVKDFPNVFLRKGNEEDFFDVLTRFKKVGALADHFRQLYQFNN